MQDIQKYTRLIKKGFFWKLSEEVNKNNTTKDSIFLNSMLHALWWRDNITAKELLSSSNEQSSSVEIFAKAYTEMCLGDGDAVPRTLPQLQKIDAPTWMRQWLIIEHQGRICEYESQSKLIEKSMLNAQEWPLIAAYNSLERPHKKGWHSFETFLVFFLIFLFSFFLLA